MSRSGQTILRQAQDERDQGMHLLFNRHGRGQRGGYVTMLENLHQE